MKLHTTPDYKAKKSIYLIIFLTFLWPTISSAEESVTTEPNKTQLANLETLKSTGDCSNCDLGNVDLEKASLSNADLEGAILNRAKLRNADLSNANLSGANLS